MQYAKRSVDSDRKPLDWKSEHTFNFRNAYVEIKSARIQGKKVYSFKFFRLQGEKPAAYFREDDLRDLEGVVSEAKLWVQADEVETRDNRTIARA